MKQLKIAYITETSPHDKHAWSGTVHYAFKALQRAGHTVNALGPAKPKFIGFFCKIINQLLLKIVNKRFDYRHSTIYSKAFGKIFTKKLTNISYDVVVVCGGTEYGAYIKTTKPMYYILDRTIEGALNYHSILSNLLAFSEKQSIYTDKRAMYNATKVFFSSQWAAEHAKQFYQLPPEKCAIVPFGANLKNPPKRELILNKTKSKLCKLLFIGVYWENKGGSIAYNALIKLLDMGIDAELTICGCIPPKDFKHDKITVIPFLNKNIKEEEEKLYSLYEHANFLILPTRFEAYGLVFCEASAYGVPSLATDTGGVSGVITEGKNGYLLPYEDLGDGYAKKIKEIWLNDIAYKQLSLSSREEYETRLNWDSWVQKLQRKFDEYLSYPANQAFNK